MQAKAPALTTATACSSAVTGVGATAALMSQLCMGQMAALTPQPTKASTNTLSSRSILPLYPARWPPGTNSCASLTIRNTMPIKASAAPTME